MKKSVLWGILLPSLLPLIASAQTLSTIPWPQRQSVWERTAASHPGAQYLSYRQAPELADPAAAEMAEPAAEIEPQPLPEPADEAEPVPAAAATTDARVDPRSLYDYSYLAGPGPAGVCSTGDYCGRCGYGGHWSGWLPKLFTWHHGGGDACQACGDGACSEPSCPEPVCVETACCGCGCGNWFGGVYGLALTRSDDARTALSYDAANWHDPLLRSSDADVGTLGGVGVRFGRYLHDCCYAIEAGYWGLVPGESEANVCNGCHNVELNSPIGFDGLVYDNGAFVDDVAFWYGTPGDMALRHRLRRKFEAHNIELNLIRNPFRRSGCVHFELLVGIRFLKFDDNFSFATNYTSDTFGNDPANELDYVIDTENYLLGCQVGGRMDYYVWGGLSVNAATTLGIYGNHMRHEQFIWGGTGFATIDGTGDYYNVERTADDVAFLGDLSAGISYDLTQCWRITCGYRATIASGVALATSQIPRDAEFANMLYSPTIDSNDSLVLHGGYAGLEFNW